MKSFHYALVDVDHLVTSLRPEGRIYVAESTDSKTLERATRIALMSLRLANRLGIDSPSTTVKDVLPYSSSCDTVIFPAEAMTSLINRKVYLLRGWQQFQSCIKGFNALGLMAEQVLRWLDEYETTSDYEKAHVRESFIRAKGLLETSAQGENSINLLDIAIWSCFSTRTIVCSTSSNMGISLHEILRLMQKTPGVCNAGKYMILNESEGRLIIWCPDERADFMNQEKAQLLRAIESELPPLTRLRTYINRQQRDPGALQDAVDEGGYFFPTNPQSAQELQNLLFSALVGDSGKTDEIIKEIALSPKALFTLESLGCVVDREELTIEVRRGVEGGIHGLMVPYWLLIEEISHFQKHTKLDVWNQASIGAALAAAVLAEEVVRHPESLRSTTQAEFSNNFPKITSFFIDEPATAQQRRILGVFDIANLQSLAQLLGVTIPHHSAGRSTAFVGLGSSSYSNGNRCFEILDSSATSSGAFRGRLDFLPATHTLSPVAQALVVGEDLFRIFQKDSIIQGPVSELLHHVKKPEPAGAAALAGLLLKMLDQGTLTVFELAHSLRSLGFTSSNFLRLHNLEHSADSEQQFIQLAFEEGPFMGQFAADLLSIMDWPVTTLENHDTRQKANRQSLQIIDQLADSIAVLYLTGDNCGQPKPELLVEILKESTYKKWSETF